MPRKTRPISPSNAPDPARVYERAKPEAEAGMGKLSVPRTRRSRRPDRMQNAVDQRQENRQLNADDIVNAAGNALPKGKP